MAVLAFRELHHILSLSISCLYLQFKNACISQACVLMSTESISHSWELLALNSFGMLLAYSLTPPLP